MKRALTTGLCLALSFLAFAAVGAVDASAELNDIINQLLKPAAQKASDAIPLMMADPAKACQLETEASTDIEQAYARVQTLETQLKAEGRDVAPLQPLKGKLEQAVPAFRDNKTTACSGEMARLRDDPVMGPMFQKIGAYMKAFTDDTLAAQTALQQKDKATYCQRLTDGRGQLNDLTAYLATWRKTHTLSPGDTVTMDGFANQVAGFQASNDAKLKQCPAA